MAWYRAGTISVTNGSTTLTGSGTAFVSNVQIGHAINLPDGRAYEVLNVVSDTQITLGMPYLGTTVSGQSYSVQPNQGFSQVAASRLADFITQYGGYTVTSLSGSFTDGSVAVPGIRFSLDQDSGLRRSGENIVSLVTGGVDRLTVDGSGASANGNFKAVASEFPRLGVERRDIGNWWMGGYGAGINNWALQFNAIAPYMVCTTNGDIGIGTSSPTSGLHIFRANGADNIAYFQQNTAVAGSAVARFDAAGGGGNVAGIDLQGSTYIYRDVSKAGLCIGFDKIAANAAVTIDGSGNLLVGTTAGTVHTIGKTGTQGATIFEVTNGSFNDRIVQFYSTSASANSANSSATAIRVGRNTDTNRSISAGGTINASGADYAEYMRKCRGCALLAKGAVVGIDTNGELTDKFSEAHSFVVKSTDPSLVGGDVWGTKPKPEEPVLSLTPYTGDNDDEEAKLSHKKTNDEEQLKYDTAKTKYEADLAEWETQHEKERACVDRIAFSGQVPCNVVLGEFKSGDYIVGAEGPEDTIIGAVVNKSEMTLDKYMARVGKVWKKLEDGRAWIDVQHG